MRREPGLRPIPPELHNHLQAAFDNLELVTRLDFIRLKRALVKPRALIKGPTELLGVLTLQDDKALVVWNEPGQNIKEGGLAARRRSGDEHTRSI